MNVRVPYFIIFFEKTSITRSIKIYIHSSIKEKIGDLEMPLVFPLGNKKYHDILHSFPFKRFKYFLLKMFETFLLIFKMLSKLTDSLGFN